MNKKQFYFISVISVLVVMGVSLLLVPPVQETFALSEHSPADLYVFDGYETWPSSATAITSPTLGQTLFLLALMTETDRSSRNSESFVDINGDGLVDLLHHHRSSASESGELFWAAVMLNKGGMDFDLVYRCVYSATDSLYYGDCADL